MRAFPQPSDVPTPVRSHNLYAEDMLFVPVEFATTDAADTRAKKGSRERMRATHTGGGKNKSVPKPHNGWVNIYTKKFTQVIGRHANTHTRIPHRKHVHSARKNCNNKLSATVEVRTPRFVPHSHAGVPVFDADTCVPALQVPRRNTPWGFLQEGSVYY